MKFRYKGEVHLENFLGQDWNRGSVHDYTDAYSIQKLTNNPTLFEEVKAAPVVASPAALEAALDATEPVAVPQMPRRRGPNKPKPETA